MDEDRLNKANEKLERLKEKKKSASQKSDQKTGNSSKEAFRKNLGCGG